MKRPSSHLRLTLLLVLMLLLATGGLMLASGLAGAVPLAGDGPHEALDRVVPGMTRAEDLAGLGLGDLEMVSGGDAAARITRIDRAVDACRAAAGWCTGYLLHQDGAPDAVLLVMDGRVVFKGIAA